MYKFQKRSIISLIVLAFSSVCSIYHIANMNLGLFLVLIFTVCICLSYMYVVTFILDKSHVEPLEFKHYLDYTPEPPQYESKKPF